MESCAFDTLFAKSVPKILEKIFFSLDYASFKNCLEVSRAWNELLTTKKYQWKGKLVFRDELKKDKEELWNTSRFGKYEEVRRLLSSGMLDVDCEFGSLMNTPLHEASLNGHTDIVQFLLHKGADPNKRNSYGKTPLHVASSNGHKGVVQLLLEGGAEPRGSDNSGQTPRAYASRNGHKDVKKVLTEWRRVHEALLPGDARWQSEASSTISQYLISSCISLTSFHHIPCI